MLSIKTQVSQTNTHSSRSRLLDLLPTFCFIAEKQGTLLSSQIRAIISFSLGSAPSSAPGPGAGTCTRGQEYNLAPVGVSMHPLKR